MKYLTDITGELITLKANLVKKKKKSIFALISRVWSPRFVLPMSQGRDKTGARPGRSARDWPTC